MLLLAAFVKEASTTTVLVLLFDGFVVAVAAATAALRVTLKGLGLGVRELDREPDAETLGRFSATLLRVGGLDDAETAVVAGVSPASRRKLTRELGGVFTGFTTTLGDKLVLCNVLSYTARSRSAEGFRRSSGVVGRLPPLDFRLSSAFVCFVACAFLVSTGVGDGVGVRATLASSDLRFRSLRLLLDFAPVCSVAFLSLTAAAGGGGFADSAEKKGET